MTDEQEPTAVYYRKTAQEIIELAQKSQLPQVQRDLLELAERFRRMAEYVEKRHPNGRGRLGKPEEDGDT